MENDKTKAHIVWNFMLEPVKWFGIRFQEEASKVTRIWAEQPKNCGFIPSGKEIFIYSMASSADLGPTQLPVP